MNPPTFKVKSSETWFVDKNQSILKTWKSGDIICVNASVTDHLGPSMWLTLYECPISGLCPVDELFSFTRAFFEIDAGQHMILLDKKPLVPVDHDGKVIDAEKHLIENSAPTKDNVYYYPHPFIPFAKIPFFLIGEKTFIFIGDLGRLSNTSLKKARNRAK